VISEGGELALLICRSLSAYCDVAARYLPLPYGDASPVLLSAMAPTAARAYVSGLNFGIAAAALASLATPLDDVRRHYSTVGGITEQCYVAFRESRRRRGTGGGDGRGSRKSQRDTDDARHSRGRSVMKVYELQGPDGAEGLNLVDRPVPQPAAGQVLVRMKAATLNYRDLLTVNGGYGSRQKFPLIPVSDGAGTVETVGTGVRQFATGDRVVGSFFENWLAGEPSKTKMDAALGGSVDGVLAEYRIFPAHALVKTPPHLDDAEAAALPCAGLTAWSAVVKLGGVKPGQTVLTQGTGGVSLFALQFAKMCGARVIATSSSDAKIERLKILGADVTINYKTTPDWGKKARKLTGYGVDLVVEVGGTGTLNESIRATRIGGTIAFIGVLAGPPPANSRLPLMVMQQQRLQGITVGSVEDLQAMCDAISLNRMKPVIDKTFSFDEVREAFARMSSGAHFGKVAIAIE
jgi:NADPH:quinone reductase-like Zn-dependent oxidoreductase